MTGKSARSPTDDPARKVRAGLKNKAQSGATIDTDEAVSEPPHDPASAQQIGKRTGSKRSGTRRSPLEAIQPSTSNAAEVQPAFSPAPDYLLKQQPGTDPSLAPADLGARYRINQEALLAALPHPVFVVAPNNQFLFTNAAAEAFFQTSDAMLRRVRLEDLLGSTSPLVSLAGQVRESGSTLNEYEVEIASPRFPGPRLVDIYAGAVADAPGAVVLMLQQRSMAQLIERQLTHRVSARSVSGLASVLAHEIKNPLSGIRGAAQLLEQNLSDEDRILSQLICNETDRIRKLVDRMDVFGDERPIEKEPINIHDVLNHVRRLSESGFAKGITFAEDYDPSLPPVPGNRDTLVQALLNLVKNAAEAIRDQRENGRISMRTAYRPGVRLTLPGTSTRVALPLMIQIEDNGVGVPDHLKPHLFDPFVTTKLHGTGLGLALVAKIIGDHGGVIECENDLHRTIFRILLPTYDQPHARSTG